MEFRSYCNKPAVTIRILSLGNAGTGKSCLIKRYCEKRFSNKYVPTIGVDYGSLTVDVDGRRLSVHFFDTSGKLIFKDVRTEFYNDIQAILLTYDVNDRSSFLALESWLNELKQYLGAPSEWKCVVLVCGTRTDTSALNVRQVSEAEGRNWACKHKFLHIVTSSALGLGVSQAFYTIFINCLQMKDGISVGSNPSKKNDDPEASRAISVLLHSNNDAERLGLSRNELSKDQITKAYRKIASLVHPDKCKIGRAEEAFKVLSQAKINLLKRCDSP